MSGRIELHVRKGFSKDRRYSYYPEAFLIITGEDGTCVNISPKYGDIMKMLMDFRKHELKVDLNRVRKSYVSRLINELDKTLNEIKVVTLTEYDNVEEIYKQEVKKWKRKY